MKRLVIVGALLASVCMPSLEGEAQRRTQRRSSRKSAGTKTNSETEAASEARKLADRFVTRCDDDTYRGYLDRHVVEWKGYHLITQPETVTQADKFNGIESKMIVRIRFDARRLNGKWIDESNGFCLTLTKQAGAWKANACSVLLQELYGGMPPPNKPNCAESIAQIGR